MQNESLKSAVEALMRRDAPVTEQKPVEAKPEIVETENPEEPNETIIEDNEPAPEAIAEGESEEEKPVFEIEFRGEKKQVDIDELQKGYIEYLKGEKRQSDYTSKFQAVAEKEKTLSAKEQQIAQEAAIVNQYRDNLVILNQVLETPPVDPNSLDRLLAEGDTEGYLKANKQLEEWKGKKFAIQQELVKVTQYQQQKHAQELANRQAQERLRLQEKAPDLLKEDNAKKLLDTLKTAYGITPEEAALISDHRLFLLANDARLYREMLAKAKDVKKNPTAPKVIKKGSAKVDYSQSEDYRKARAQLAKTGSTEDAIRAFLLKQTKGK